jgi:hypothetical protein
MVDLTHLRMMLFVVRRNDLIAVINQNKIQIFSTRPLHVYP